MTPSRVAIHTGITARVEALWYQTAAADVHLRNVTASGGAGTISCRQATRIASTPNSFQTEVADM
jgi:hypothetical protein